MQNNKIPKKLNSILPVLNIKKNKKYLKIKEYRNKQNKVNKPIKEIQEKPIRFKLQENRKLYNKF